ncbi:sulfurtransferase [soil metagenome]
MISAADLRSLISAGEQVTVLDVRYRLGAPAGLEVYAAGHIRSAAYVDLDADLATAPGGVNGGRHPLPTPEDFAAAMRRSGVRSDRPVVVYDDWQGLAAGRCWWLLRHHGHPDVRVLDGGWSAWLAAGGEVETDAPELRPGDFAPTLDPGVAAVATDDVLGVEVLIDARAPERYRGETEPMDAVAGHIPGAVNVPTSRNLTEDGRFRPVDELRELYAEVGAVPGADVAVYCGSGVTAVHDLIALELIGVRGRLYPGSWSEWSADPERPVETG